MVMELELELGSFYEIDHTELPPNSPVQLNSIRVVMATEKTETHVYLRFTSMSSLRNHFNNGSQCRTLNDGVKMMIPVLDEKCVMDLNVGRQVLSRKIPSEEWSEQKDSWNFWVVGPSMASEKCSTIVDDDKADEVVSKKGSCWSELKCGEMIRWGIRHKVKFIGRHNPEFSSNTSLDSSENKLVEEKKKKDEDEKVNKREEEEEEEEENQKGKEIIRRKNRKRKCTGSKTIIPIKRQKEKKSQISNPTGISRWSAERFKLAEVNMLKVMKAKEAVAGNPILRQELRQEARKKIGDTGLLDHLLKHMAGKVAPGGADRFRRRHNPEGMMEYWLESADLVRIRKEAGVQDPFWVPPVGWKPGDNPTQDPIFAMETRLIKEEISKLNREIEGLKTQKQVESNKASVITLTPSYCAKDQNMEQHYSSYFATKEMWMDLVKRNCELEKQVIKLSHSQKEMEKELGKLKSFSVKQLQADKSESGSGALEIGAAPTPVGTETNDKYGNVEKNKEYYNTVQVSVAKAKQEEEEQKGLQKANTTAAAAAAKAEEKAARLQRLKSGFKICKPQGTFLWPDMSSPAPTPLQTVYPIPLLPPPPPPSPSPLPPPLPPTPLPSHPPSPVKPLAQRRSINITASTQKKPTISSIETTLPESDHGSNTITGSTPTTTSHGHLIDLNNFPSNDSGFCGTPTSSFSTYKRSNISHSVTTTVSMPSSKRKSEMKPLLEVEAEKKGGGIEYNRQLQQRVCSPSSSSSLSMDIRDKWFGLAAPKSSLDNSEPG